MKATKKGRWERMKWDIIRDIFIKGGKANKPAQQVFFRGLEYKTKAQLERILKRMRVTRGGDIRLS